MPPTLFLDHWALQGLVKSPSLPEHELLVRAIHDREIRLVVSLLNLYEIAGSDNAQFKLAQAALIDQLMPLWLRLRRYLLTEEVAVAFRRWRCESGSVPAVEPFLVSPGQYGAEEGGPTLIVRGQDSAVGFIEGFMEEPRLLEQVDRSRQEYDYQTTHRLLRTSRSLGEASYEQALADAIHRMILERAPLRDSGGDFTSEAEREQFAQECSYDACPSLHVDIALHRAKMKRNFLASRSEEIDLHYSFSTLPYVDHVVVDRQFADLIRRAKRDCTSIHADVHQNIRGAVSAIQRCS